MFNLQDLIGPDAVESFLKEAWPATAYWDAQSSRRAQLFHALPEFSDPLKLLSIPGRFGMFAGGGKVETTEDPDVVTRAYREGRTCFLHGDHLPGLADARDRIAADLGLARDAMRVEVFCSPGASGAPMHSDYDINLAVLVSGVKRWRIAPNAHVENPVSQSFAGAPAGASSVEAQLARRLPLPASMPDDAISLEMCEGGLLLLPRGWWHETTTEGPCVQVNFAVKSPMMMTVLSRTLKTMLLPRPEWREYAVDLFANDGREVRAREALAARASELATMLTGLTKGRDPQLVAADIISLSGLGRVGD